MSELKHIGVKRRSGRYPYGSGDNPYQRGSSPFLERVNALKKEGMSDTEIARTMGIKRNELVNRRSIERAEQRKADYAYALKLKEKGYSNVAIGKRMGINESSVRSLLDPAIQERSEITTTTANMLKDNIEKYGAIDIGLGVEHHIGISRTKLKTAVSMLEEEGYKTHFLKVEQLGTGKPTSVMVLSKPDMTYSEVYKNRDKIGVINNHTEDGGRSYKGLEPVQFIDSNRVKIRYGDEGGSDMDGVIQLRRGVEDLSLGNSRYAQVRIGVDGTHFLKGMAIYSDDIPDGVDIIYNTNKKTGTAKKDVFKPVETDAFDPTNPFGASISRQKGALNIVNEEGDWSTWKKSLSSQMLSKQPPALAKKQLGITYDIMTAQYDEIMSLTNPAIRKKMLLDFAEDCDAKSVHLKAAGLPRQESKVILPFPNMKDNEVYAPTFRDGENVVLIRYPHGGIFEIPSLKVNNRIKEAVDTIGRPKDAIGIHPKVAEKLSGADFDGDTVLVIPTKGQNIKTSPSLKALQNFDPKTAYPAYEGMPKMSEKTKQFQMGIVSNLITDMTVKRASDAEIARAVKHSMVVIDAKKHNLNYKQSAKDNMIGQLKEKYQGGANKGASTLISKASSTQRVDVRKDRGIDKETGKKKYVVEEEYYVNKQGKTVKRTIKSTKMAEVDDAFDLSSGTYIEAVYADHANKLKALANKARKDYVNTKNQTYSPSAKKAYANEVSTLTAKLNIALKNKPLERQAQLIANEKVKTKIKANPDMDADDIKKLKAHELNNARVQTGARKKEIVITDNEWNAIQAGALSTNQQMQIFNNTDADSLRKRALPRTQKGISDSKISRAKVLLDSGYTQAEVADSLGISVSSLSKALE